MPNLPPFGYVDIGANGGNTMNVALYARVSSEKQDVDLSISAQLGSMQLEIAMK